MSYQYNPHSHVKVWLSKDRDVFMNFENQTRLIDIRFNNPKAQLSLVYDSTLLNPQAQQDLALFCQENSIDPIDANTFYDMELTEKEKTLLTFYKDEITHLTNGGNLGVASDILRVLPPTYRQGTYSDLDAPVDTHALPDVIEVDSPLLLNMGSLKLFGQKELIYAVNELIAVVDEEGARLYLEKLHKGMIKQLTEFKSDLIDKSINDVSQNSYIRALATRLYKGRPDAVYIDKSNELTPPDNNRSSRNLRTYIYDMTSDSAKYIEFHRQTPDEDEQDVIKRLREEVRAQAGITQWLFARAEYNNAKQMLALDDEAFVQAHMAKERSFYLRFIVLCTTGPLEMTNSLFNSLIVTKDYIDENVKQMTFRHYGVDKEFAVCIQIPLHASIGDIFELLNKDVGINSDASWLPEGISNIQEREKAMRARQEVLRTGLAEELAESKKHIEAYRDTLQNRQDGWFGFIFHSRRQAKIDALNKVLGCFDNDAGTLDIRKFKNALEDIKPNEKVIFAGYFSSNTKQLIKGLEKLCREAVVLSVTKDQMPSFTTSKQSPNPMSKLLTGPTSSTSESSTTAKPTDAKVSVTANSVTIETAPNVPTFPASEDNGFQPTMK
jgi:glucosyltransferase Lgt1/2/3